MTMWIKSSINAAGVKTIYPPEPKEEMKPHCSFCGQSVQFVHFFSDVLRLLTPESKVPYFCCVNCKKRFVDILSSKKYVFAPEGTGRGKGRDCR